MTEGTIELKGFKKFLYRKFKDIKPEVKFEVSFPFPGKMTIIARTQNFKQIKFIEVTLRDQFQRDYLVKLHKRKGILKSTVNVKEGKNFELSFYVMGKNGMFNRISKKISDILVVEPIAVEKKKSEVQKPNKTTTPKPKKASGSQSKQTNAKTQSIKNIPPPKKRNWPNSSTYAQALQKSSFSINSLYPNIREASFLKNQNVKYSTLIQGAGNFGVVFKFSNGGTFHALKCFTRGGNYLELRYSEIGKALNAAKFPFFIDLKFCDNAIRTMSRPNEYFPAITMQWVDGETLYNYINKNFKISASMDNVAKSILNAIKLMQDKKIAHGDLSGDNILVGDNEKITVIDYDGMYTPSLRRVGTEELGHEAFQHPKRGRYYGEKLDNFSALIIFLSLSALSVNPALWKYNEGDPDKLIFDPADFQNPGKSPIFKDLMKLGGNIPNITMMLQEYLKHDVDWDGMDIDKIIKMK